MAGDKAVAAPPGFVKVPVNAPPANTTTNNTFHLHHGKGKVQKRVVCTVVLVAASVALAVASSLPGGGPWHLLVSCSSWAASGVLVVAVLASAVSRRVSPRVARECGLTRLPAPAGPAPLSLSWKAFPARLSFKHDRLVNAMNKAPRARYYYKFSLEPVPPVRFAARSGAAGALPWLASGGASPGALSSWLAQKRGGWLAAFSAGILEREGGTAPAGQEVDGDVGALVSAVATCFHGVSLRPAARGPGRWGYFLGTELAPVLSLPRELSSSVLAALPVEMHSPAARRHDVRLGILVDTEILAAAGEAGVDVDHVAAGMGVCGGMPRERTAVLSSVAGQLSARGRVVVVDVTGDVSVPGAEVLVPGVNLFLNPLLPAGGTSPSEAHLHAVASVLSMTFELAPQEKQRAYGLLREAAEESDGQVMSVSLLGGIGGQAAPRDERRPSPVDVRASECVADAFVEWHRRYHAITEGDPFKLGSAGATVVDLSGVNGIARHVMQGVIAVKVLEGAAAAARGGGGEAPRPAGPFLVMAGLDEAFPGVGAPRTGAHGQCEDEFLHLFEAVNRSGTGLVFSCQSARKLPVAFLARLGAVVSFAQPHHHDLSVLETVLQLDQERLHGNRRQSSHQARYLQRLDRGEFYLKVRGEAPCLATLPPAGTAGGDDKPTSPMKDGGPAAGATPSPGALAVPSLLESVLCSYPALRGEILDMLRRLAGSGGGLKQGTLVELWAAKIEAGARRKDPSLTTRQVKQGAIKTVRGVVDALLAARLLVQDGYNATGLVNDRTVSLSELGRRFLEVAAGGEQAGAECRAPEGNGGAPRTMAGVAKAMAEAAASLDTPRCAELVSEALDEAADLLVALPAACPAGIAAVKAAAVGLDKARAMLLAALARGSTPAMEDAIAAGVEAMRGAMRAGEFPPGREGTRRQPTRRQP